MSTVERMIGRAIKRREDPKLITGQGQFVDDVKLPGMLHAFVVRSPYAHAKIVSIDTSAALAVPGVVAVFTGEDMTDINPLPCAWQAGRVTNNVNTPRALAVGKVLHVGDGVALVVAEDRYIARDAADLVEVEYDPLPVVVDARKATEEGAPQLHENAPRNVVMEWECGDRAKADAAFAIKPVAADQLFSGSVPLPTPFNDALDDFGNSSYPIVLDPPVNLTEGNYYLTVYGAAANDFAHGGTAACNWAWFIYSPGAVRQILPNGTAYSWRSADFNTGGFLLYQGLATGSNVQAGDDQLDLYNNAFTILGAPVAGGVVCTGDLDNSGTVDAADLAGLLGQWGGPGSADFDGSGTVDAADLAQLLGAWGPCP